MQTAAEIYSANVYETHKHFFAMEDALYDEYIKSDMCVTEFDRRRDAIRAQRAYYLAQEEKLYYLNLERDKACAITCSTV